jgi:hypothetical protein
MSVIGVEKDFDSLSLTLFADFAAPIERVWRLWADPRQPVRCSRSRSARWTPCSRPT